jgi:hypothetical protein
VAIKNLTAEMRILVQMVIVNEDGKIVTNY